MENIAILLQVLIFSSYNIFLMEDISEYFFVGGQPAHWHYTAFYALSDT